MGEYISEEAFEVSLLKGLTDDYEFLKMTSFYGRNVGIGEIRSMMKNFHQPTLEPGNDNKLNSRGAVMATRQGPRKACCYNFQEFGPHKQQEGTICYTKMVLAAQLDYTRQCRVQREEAEQGEHTTGTSTPQYSHSDWVDGHG